MPPSIASRLSASLNIVCILPLGVSLKAASSSNFLSRSACSISVAVNKPRVKAVLFSIPSLSPATFIMLGRPRILALSSLPRLGNNFSISAKIF